MQVHSRLRINLLQATGIIVALQLLVCSTGYGDFWLTGGAREDGVFNVRIQTHPKQEGIYGAIRFARASLIAVCQRDVCIYPGLLMGGRMSFPGADGICASSPNQVNGLGKLGPPQALKKLVSPRSPSCLAQAPRKDISP